MRRVPLVHRAHAFDSKRWGCLAVWTVCMSMCDTLHSFESEANAASRQIGRISPVKVWLRRK
ncbi:protein of unknown function [Microbacterium sp. Nx66]|nr:protein of unknown function [Microbacterium sp. Nx66]